MPLPSHSVVSGGGQLLLTRVELSTPEAAAALIHALSTEIDVSVADMVARSVGRLGLPDTAAARSAEAAIRSRLTTQQTPGWFMPSTRSHARAVSRGILGCPPSHY